MSIALLTASNYGQ